MVRRIVKSHPEDEFIFFFDRPYDPAFIFGKNVTPVVLNPPARHPFLWYWWFEQSLPTALKKYQPDVFFSPDNYLSLKTKVKTLLVTHDLAHVYYPDEIPYFTRKFYDYYVPKYINRADHIIAVSDFTKQDILKNYGIPAEKVEVIYNACTENFKPADRETQESIRTKYADGQEYFFYIGSINPRKNIERLIQAFDLFKTKTKSSMKLLLGGRLAWQSGPVKETFERAHHKSDIQLLGYLEEEELPKVIASATALVYVSLFEGFGLPILEAMHCETAVITSDVTSMPEVAGEAALMIDPRSVEEIAEAMQKIQASEVATRLVELGKQQREKFNWDDSAAKVYACLQKMN